MFEGFPEQEPWWQKAREDVKPYTALYSWLPDSLPQERQDLVFENLYEFVSMLLAEIIASPDAECTYFREQLSWFHAGHLPCEWDGDWPTGRASSRIEFGTNEGAAVGKVTDSRDRLSFAPPRAAQTAVLTSNRDELVSAFRGPITSFVTTNEIKCSR